MKESLNKIKLRKGENNRKKLRKEAKNKEGARQIVCVCINKMHICAITDRMYTYPHITLEYRAVRGLPVVHNLRSHPLSMKAIDNVTQSIIRRVDR